MPSGVNDPRHNDVDQLPHKIGTLPAASPAPATAPTIEWVVDTGNFKYVAANSHMPEANIAAKAITSTDAGRFGRAGRCPKPMVLMTRWPKRSGTS